MPEIAIVAVLWWLWLGTIQIARQKVATQNAFEDLLEGGMRVTGWVSDYERQDVDVGYLTFVTAGIGWEKIRPVARFNDLHGNTFEIKGGRRVRWHNGETSLRIGDPLKVLYLRDQPDQAMLEDHPPEFADGLQIFDIVSPAVLTVIVFIGTASLIGNAV